MPKPAKKAPISAKPKPAKPAAAAVGGDTAAAMKAMENTGLILGMQVAMAFEQTLKETLVPMLESMAGAIAEAFGGKGPLPPKATKAQTDLRAAVTKMRSEFKMDTDRRDAAAKRLKPDSAAQVLKAAEAHLQGLPDIRSELTDDQVAGYLALMISEDARMAAWVQAVMPVMQSLEPREA